MLPPLAVMKGTCIVKLRRPTGRREIKLFGYLAYDGELRRSRCRVAKIDLHSVLFGVRACYWSKWTKNLIDEFRPFGFSRKNFRFRGFLVRRPSEEYRRGRAGDIHIENIPNMDVRHTETHRYKFDEEIYGVEY